MIDSELERDRMPKSDDNGYILKVSNLTVRLQGEVIIDNLSFNLRKGITLAVFGPNGAGKTTLVKALLNLVPYEGTIEWEEKVKVGYVPQNIAVSDIPISVKEFLSAKSHSSFEKYLSLVKLTDKGILSKNLGLLSGGELRKVLIAWALIDDPNVLLFDEPTTGVDMGSEESIYVMLGELKQKRKITMVLISHDVHIVREHSDFVLALNRSATFFGESSEIMNPSIQQMICGETVCRGLDDEGRYR
jgi:zinc transport system ATP-binding protein